MSELKKTPLHAEHLAAGARMTPFGGWDMPVQYAEGILAEHLRTRFRTSLFDICHMGEFMIRGLGAAPALDRVFARSTADLKSGVCRYNFLLSDDGGVLDDVIVYRLSTEEFMVVVNASTRESDAARIVGLLDGAADFTDVSDETAKLDLQGPQTPEVLCKLGVMRSAIPHYFGHARMKVAGIDALVSRTGYTGELGVEIYVPSTKAVELWRRILEVPMARPAGLGARDTLRLEMGYPLYGHELDIDTTPVEAGFGALLDKTGKRQFAGHARLKARRPVKRLTAIILDGRRAARAGMAVQDCGGDVIGVVTSGAFSPCLSKAIALAYCHGGEPREAGTPILVDIGGGKTLEGEVVSLPFYKDGTARLKIDA